MKQEEISIPLSKSKLLFLALLCLGFVSLGVWLLLFAPQLDIFGSTGKFVQKFAGALAIGFFGPAGFFLVKKSLDKTPGLRITSEGIFDNSSMVAIGMILWSDISGVEESVVGNERFIRIKVKNPEKYIDKSRGGIPRKSMEVNYKKFGSPIQISVNGLEASHDEIREVLTVAYDNYRKPKNKRKN